MLLSSLMAAYLNRLVDAEIATHLRTFGAVLLEGPRGVGKTTSGLRHSSSSIRLDADPGQLLLAKSSPETVLRGDVPRLIDEWQLTPELWNVLRHELDRRSAPGQFILTGSARPTDDVTRHTGAGRIGRLRIRPMSMAESNESTGDVSLADLLQGNNRVAAIANTTVPDYAALLVRGGWPTLVAHPETDSYRYLASYMDNAARLDLNLVPGAPRRDPQRVMALLRALARNVSTEASLALLGREAGAGNPLAAGTVRQYIDDLTRLFVVEELPAWHVHLRSKVRVRVQPTWHFADPSLAAVMIGASAKHLIDDPATFGLFFESLAIRDLRVYATTQDANVYHYRDDSGLEVDAIIERRDGTWLAAEIKLGGQDLIDTAAVNLKQLENKVSDERREALRNLVVITGGKASYTREDGVHVVALGTLTA